MGEKEVGILMKDIVVNFFKMRWREFIIFIFALSLIIFTYKHFTKNDSADMNPIIIKNEGVKIDLSLDRGFLSCVRIQQKCLYSNLNQNVEAQKTLENCKEIDFCDKKYSRSN